MSLSVSLDANRLPVTNITLVLDSFRIILLLEDQITRLIHPPNWDDAKKSGKIMKKSGKKSGKKYAKMRELRDIAIRKIKIK